MTKNVSRQHLHASFSTFCVQIGQLFESQWAFAKKDFRGGGAQWAEIIGQEEIDNFPEFYGKIETKIHFRHIWCNNDDIS